MQAYEGYFENGQFYPIGRPVSIQGRRRVILTVFDEFTPIYKKPDTWAELDKIVSEMSEKPRLEDFPRCQFGRELTNFEEIQWYEIRFCHKHCYTTINLLDWKW